MFAVLWVKRGCEKPTILSECCSLTSFFRDGNTSSGIQERFVEQGFKRQAGAVPERRLDRGFHGGIHGAELTLATCSRSSASAGAVRVAVMAKSFLWQQTRQEDKSKQPTEV
jgi:hypothetical protein